MDATDIQILNSLQEDCTRTLRSIGEKVGLTPPAVGERIRKMEDEGIIRSYRIRIDRTRLDCGITGFIMVACEPEKYTAFCRFCEQSEMITAWSCAENMTAQSLTHMSYSTRCLQRGFWNAPLWREHAGSS